MVRKEVRMNIKKANARGQWEFKRWKYNRYRDW